MHAALPDALGLRARCMHAHLVSPAVPMGAQYILYLPCDHADRSLFSATMSLHMVCRPYYVSVTSHFFFMCQTLLFSILVVRCAPKCDCRLVSPLLCASVPSN